jgi:hypothetical protein
LGKVEDFLGVFLFNSLPFVYWRLQSVMGSINTQDAPQKRKEIKRKARDFFWKTFPKNLMIFTGM